MNCELQEKVNKLEKDFTSEKEDLIRKRKDLQKEIDFLMND